MMILKRIYWSLRETFRNTMRNIIVDPVKSVDVRGRNFRIGMTNPLEGFRIATYSSKEPETLDWIEKSKDPFVLFDVGANIGLYSIYAGKLFPNSKVYAFEPESLNFTRLLRNIANNGTTNVCPVNVALTDHTSFGFMKISSLEASAALHTFETTTKSDGFRQGLLGVSLDDLVYQFKLPCPTMLKVDVDGLENEIFEGSKKVLSDPICRNVLVEVECKDINDTVIHKILTQAGFKLNSISAWSITKASGAKIQNYIYAK